MTHEPEDPYLEDFLESAFRSTSLESDVAPARALEAELDEETVPDRVGPYPVVDSIGRGGVGDVFRVSDPSLGRELAIKVLRRKHTGNHELIRSFEEEARLCSELTHPGVVPIHVIGKLEDGRPYFTMRLVEGRTLADRLRGRARREDERRAFLEILEKTCQTLAYAHARGIVHGDVTPQNVMVGAFGEVQVMDWGFAHRHGARACGEGPSKTARESESTVRGGGTPAYMSPEQARRAGELGPRTDVYGLGAVLCEILTGEAPYSGGSKQRIIGLAAEAKLEDATRRLRESGAESALVDLTLACLAEDPAGRPADAGEVAARLSAYLEGLERRARQMELEVAATQASLAQARRARRFAVAFAGTVALTVLVVATLVVWNLWAAEQRRSRVGGAVQDAMREAIDRRGEARATSDLDAWKAAVAAARRAEALAKTPDATDRVASRARTLAAEIAAEHGRALREAVLIRELQDIAPHIGDERPAAELDARFRDAFVRAGIDVDTPGGAPERAAAAIRAFAAHPTLVAALDSWMHLRRRHGIPEPGAWKAQLALARALDADPWRAVLRDACAARDRARLVAIAKEAATRTRPAASLDSLARCLYELGARDEAIALYRSAQAEHPGDFNLCHNLAVLLDWRDDAGLQEALRLLWMALALRPRDAHLRADLALYLMHDEKVTSAIQMLSEAKELAPRSPRTHFLLGLAYEQAGRVAEARAALATAAELGHAYARLELGKLFVHEARYDKALPELRKAVELLPRAAHAALQLGALLCQLRDFEAGLPQLLRAVRLDASWPEAQARLGLALIEMGSFEEGLKATRGAARLEEAAGTDGNSADLLARAHRIVAADRRLDRLLAEGSSLDGLEDAAMLGWVARRKGRAKLALRLLGEALGRERAPEAQAQLRADAVLAALAVQDGPSSEDERAPARDQALGWLGEDLASMRSGLKAEELSVAAVRERLLLWLHDARLERLGRDPAAPTGWAEIRRDLEVLLRSLDDR